MKVIKILPMVEVETDGKRMFSILSTHPKPRHRPAIAIDVYGREHVVNPANMEIL